MSVWPSHEHTHTYTHIMQTGAYTHRAGNRLTIRVSGMEKRRKELSASVSPSLTGLEPTSIQTRCSKGQRGEGSTKG